MRDDAGRRIPLQDTVCGRFGGPLRLIEHDRRGGVWATTGQQRQGGIPFPAAGRDELPLLGAYHLRQGHAYGSAGADRVTEILDERSSRTAC
jgi:hypothetical protein